MKSEHCKTHKRGKTVKSDEEKHRGRGSPREKTSERKDFGRGDSQDRLVRGKNGIDGAPGTEAQGNTSVIRAWET